jgi:uncharacterized protein with PQ loop repeat
VYLHDIAVASGYLGATLGVSMTVPQIVRTLRDRTVPGVSALSWAMIALACTSWMLYGFRTGEIPQIPGNVLLVSGAVVIALAVPSSTSTALRATGLAVAGLAIGALATVAPPPAIGILAFGIGMVSALPQTVRSLSRSRAGASAVSLPAWWLRVASQLCWFFYAVVVQDLTVTISAAFITSTALVIITGELTRRPTRANAMALV